MDRALLDRLNAEIAARRACVVVSRMRDNGQRLYLAREAPGDGAGLAAQEALRRNRSGLAQIDGQEILLTVVTPPPRLYLIGAVHLAQALAPLARLAGLDVIVVDPRAAFIAPGRFPEEARLVAKWPQDAFADEPLDAFCAVALLSHTPRIDDPALHAALDSDCFYIGALGSKRAHEGRLARLAAAGRAEQGPRIHAPIGLDIGATTPAEIAVATLAEIVATLRGGPKR